MYLPITIFSIILIFIIEGLPAIRNKQWNELITLGLILGTAFLLVIGNLMSIPSPIAMMDKLLSPFGKMLFQ